MPRCAACGAEVERSGFSANQLRKALDQRRCLVCVEAGKPVAPAVPAVPVEAEASETVQPSRARRKKQTAEAGGARCPAAEPATRHLLDRQEQRGISDEELAAAREFGERVEFEDGTVHYRYKGISYVTVDGVGITAWRTEPGHCVCGTSRDAPDVLGGAFGPRSKRDHALRAVGVGVARASFAGCEHNKPSGEASDGWRGGCIGAPQCHQHRTPTDALASYFETLDFEKPGFGELLSSLRGHLILCAAGSLLVPVRCPHCRGVKRLKRGRDALNESDAVRWIHFLLRLQPVDKRPRSGEGSVVDFRDIHNAGGCTPLGAAAKAGHFRCACVLLQWGADPQAALMDLHGPCADGHVMCLLECKARHMGGMRQHFACAQYDEIISSLHDYKPCDEAAVAMLPSLAFMLNTQLDVYANQGLFPSDDFHGFAVTATTKLGRERPDGSMECRRIGLIWDGYCWRILLKAPRENAVKTAWGPLGEAGASYASSHGFSAFLEMDGNTSAGMHMKGIENPSVKAFLKKELKKKAGPCNCYHRGGACPRGLFERAPREGPVGA
eukprot:Transcript_7729.p1 GENE.Transcript_7729~~Transcript_7729.p1  ORF type:complete len:555 (-),score=69.77 Transcript_7729:96-1760(-)